MRRRDHDRIVSELKRGYDREIATLKDLVDRMSYMSSSALAPPLVDREDVVPDEPFTWAPEQEFDAAAELE